MEAAGSSETLVNKYENYRTTTYAPKPLHLPFIPSNTRIVYSLIVDYQAIAFHSEDGSSKFLRNVGKQI
jgi:hypothetical protein